MPSGVDITAKYMKQLGIVAHSKINSSGIVTTCEFLFLCLASRNDRYGEELLIHPLVEFQDGQHLELNQKQCP